MKCVCSANRKREQNVTKNIQKRKEKKTKKQYEAPRMRRAI